MLIDTHAHLYWDSYVDDLDQVIQRSLDAGVTTIINVGVDVEKSKLALKQVQGELSKFDGLSSYSTIGIHPHEVLRLASLAQDKQIDFDVSIHEDMDKLEKLYLSAPDQPLDSARGKIIAVGECGLDYFFDPEFIPPTLPPDKIKSLQKNLFQSQIDLAKKLNLPLIVHCRDDRSKNPENSEAWDEILEMVGNYPTVLHCYSGLSLTTNYILQTTNLLVSFAATITYPKNAYLRETAKILPLEKIVLETDCPFLPPQSKRGMRNEPSAVREIAQLIAEIKGVSLDKVIQRTTANVKSIFDLES